MERQPPNSDDGSVAFYRQKASECAQAAERAANPDTRAHWLKLSSQWAFLAIHAARQTRVPPTKQTPAAPMKKSDRA